MAKNPPSVEESLADPTLPKAGSKLVKNLHIIIPGVLVTLLSIVLFSEAIKQDQAAGPTTLAAQASNELNANSNLAIPGSVGDIEAEIGRQRQVVLQPTSLEDMPMPPRPELPASLARVPTTTDGLPPVPGAPMPGRPVSDQDAAYSAEQAKRDEAIRSSQLLALSTGARTGANVVAAVSRTGYEQAAVNPPPASGAADIQRQIEERQRGASQMRDELLRQVNRSGTGAGGGGGLQPAQATGVRASNDSNSAWLGRLENASGARDLIRMEAAGPQPIVHQGSVIPAVLVTELNSDLPGQLTAMVTIDVYDTIQGDRLMIPKGSRIVGNYNNQVEHGQERVMAAFTRIIRPDGSSIDLRAMPGADHLGQSGLSDQVDNHFFKMFSSSFLVAGLAFLFERNQPDTVVVNNGSAGRELGSEAGKILVDVSRSILDRNKVIPPTLTIRKGHKFNVVVNRDMALTPYR